MVSVLCFVYTTSVHVGASRPEVSQRLFLNCFGPGSQYIYLFVCVSAPQAIKNLLREMIANQTGRTAFCGSYYCSVTSYDLLASFTALIPNPCIVMCYDTVIFVVWSCMAYNSLPCRGCKDLFLSVPVALVCVASISTCSCC